MNLITKRELARTAPRLPGQRRQSAVRAGNPPKPLESAVSFDGNAESIDTWLDGSTRQQATA